jgi:undecaprenyl-diphosphatase
MEWWQAILLGLVEGITEYLPVSSTGHLLVAQRLLGIPESAAANAYAIAIQGGAIVAVVGLYRRRLVQMLAGVRGGNRDGGRLLVSVLVAFLPAAVIGFVVDDWVEAHLFGPWPVVAAWIAGGLVILGLARHRPAGGAPLEGLTWRQALVIGFLQCLALWPGTSRSLVTILGGLLAGLSLLAAVEFSFLLGLITLGAATAFKAVQQGEAMVGSYGIVPILLGFAMAWGSAALAVRWMVTWLGRHGLGIFGWWRLVAGVVVGGLLVAGWL